MAGPAIARDLSYMWGAGSTLAALRTRRVEGDWSSKRLSRVCLTIDHTRTYLVHCSSDCGLSVMGMPSILPSWEEEGGQQHQRREHRQIVVREARRAILTGLVACSPASCPASVPVPPHSEEATWVT